jgi:hypothetical protein
LHILGTHEPTTERISRWRLRKKRTKMGKYRRKLRE